MEIINKEGTKDYKKQAVQVEIKQNTDIFTQSNQNQKFLKKQLQIFKILEKKEVWTHNYQSGTNYELYKIPLKRGIFQGLKFKDLCMILYQKENIFLIALEVRIAGEFKVFVNPSEYIFDNNFHYGYVIHNCLPSQEQINGINLKPSSAENFFIMDYLNMKE